MTRIGRDHYTITNGRGVTYHLIREYGWWHVKTTTGGWYVSTGTLPAARRWALEH